MSGATRKALILFARDPVPGCVKTRLQSILDPETTCALYRCFLDDTLETLRQLDGVDLFAGVYPSLDSGYFQPGSAGLQVFLQEGDDLGERMANAFAARFQEGYRQVVIIGSDSPTLPAEYLRRAFHSSRDVILGPSTDGGYYLIGLNGRLVPLFDGLDWGTGRVLAQTLERVAAAGGSLELLPVWYDVDLPGELRFLKAHMQALRQAGHPGGAATREFLNTLEIEASP